MKLTCGYMTIDTKSLNTKESQLFYSGQICVDGIETFIVRKDKQNNKIRYFPYGKREHVYESVVEEFAEELDSKIEELVKEKSAEIKTAKKRLSELRKADRDKCKVKKKTV
jgi:hypothetical protein